MSDVASLIDQMGGYAGIAAAIGRPAGTVAAWKHRRSIPVTYWPSIIDYADRQGWQHINYASLVAAHAAVGTLGKSGATGKAA